MRFFYSLSWKLTNVKSYYGSEYIYNVILCSSAIFYSLLINNIRSISAFVTGASICLLYTSCQYGKEYKKCGFAYWHILYFQTQDISRRVSSPSQEKRPRPAGRSWKLMRRQTTADCPEMHYNDKRSNRRCPTKRHIHSTSWRQTTCGVSTRRARGALFRWEYLFCKSPQADARTECLLRECRIRTRCLPTLPWYVSYTHLDVYKRQTTG